jgi:uncharacterized FAD-dependent dehydrogenase
MTEYLAQELKIPLSEIMSCEPVRVALDSRRKGKPFWSCNVRFTCKVPVKHPQVQPFVDSSDDIENTPSANSLDLGERVCVVGAGPAGLWAALSLARKGYAVELHEQGKPVEERFRDIRHFISGREFNARSNVLYGEGGAGAFSDGKLTSRSRTPFVQTVLDDLALAGASDEVRWLAKPHIGTDRLQKILVTVRKWIEEAGGTVFFNSKLTDLEITDGAVSRVAFDDRWQECSSLVLATGHSARDVYGLLDRRGVMLEAKPYALGVRIEHPQAFINEKQLGRGVDYSLTGAAEYTLTAQTLKGTSSAYTFCMCPGGVLIPCASESGGFATNGMSYSRRNAPFANAGIIVPVASQAGWHDVPDFKDFVRNALAPDESVELWAGIALQRALEREAFERGGRDYTAPAQTVGAFLEGKLDKALPKSSFPTGLSPTNHWEWFPQCVVQSIAEGCENFERKIPGWIHNGLIVSPETRTSSPMRVVRNECMESVNVSGLYPLGEGAGYAGGITTSAADGVRLATLARRRAK